jgi:hypothetical protein
LDFRSERRGDERDFGLAQDYRAAGSGARVRPKRLSSFLVSSRSLTAAVRHDSAWVSATLVPFARRNNSHDFSIIGTYDSPAYAAFRLHLSKTSAPDENFVLQFKTGKNFDIVRYCARQVLTVM